MQNLNVEIKARCDDPDSIRNILKENNADFRGTDHQIDTYFNVQQGRLKLREGNIEKSLIYYLKKRRIRTQRVASYYLPATGDG